MNKIKQKYYAFNTQLFFVVAMFLVFLILSICAAIEHEVGLSIGFAVATLLPIFVFFDITPLCCFFRQRNRNNLHFRTKRSYKMA